MLQAGRPPVGAPRTPHGMGPDQQLPQAPPGQNTGLLLRQLRDARGGKLKLLPTKAYPIEQFAAAMHDIKNRTVRGRFVLTMK